MPDSPSYVVTGGAHGVGRAIVERLARSGHVVIIDVSDEPDLRDERVTLISGDARDSDVTVAAARTAEASGELSGWVNNAAIFQDASFDLASPSEILELITANLALAVNGCHAAVNHYLAHSRAGAIVNISSHQAQRAVRGALQRRRAGHAFTRDALEEWHRYSLPAFTERMKTRLRNHCEDGHQVWPAKGRHTRHTAGASHRSREGSFAADVGALRPTEGRGRRHPRLGLVDLDTGEINDL